MGTLYVRWSSLNALLRAYCRRKHIKYFAHDELATEEEYYGVILTRCSTSFHRWTGNGAALQGYGLDQERHLFSRRITLPIPEEHAWGLAQ